MQIDSFYFFGEIMSRRILTMDRILYEILTESPDGAFGLHALRVEYSSRSTEADMPPNKELFWMIFMQVYALRAERLVRRVEKPEGGGVFLLENHFKDYPFNLVDRLFSKRWFNHTN